MATKVLRITAGMAEESLPCMPLPSLISLASEEHGIRGPFWIIFIGSKRYYYYYYKLY